MSRLRLAALVLASLAPSVLAVGQYLEKGQDGAGISGSLLFAEEESQYGARLGYSFGGMLDFSAGYSRASVETDGRLNDTLGTEVPGLEYGGNLFAFGLLAHPVKQSAAIPLGFSLEGGYSIGSYGGGDLEAADIDATLSALSVGGILHRTQALGPAFSVLAGVGFGWARVFMEVGDVEEEDSHTSIPLVLEGIVGLPGGGKLVIGPTLTFNENTNVFGLDVTFLKLF
jgi:hypothetical protein